MKVSLNGTATDVAEEATIVDALRLAGHEGAGFGVAVAVNGEVVPRSGWAATRLAESDRVEILVAAQGG
jgi:sulfur carrier protein